MWFEYDNPNEVSEKISDGIVKFAIGLCSFTSAVAVAIIVLALILYFIVG